MKLILFYLVAFACLVLSVACSEEEPTLKYDIADFYGYWKLYEISDEDINPCKDNPPILIISKNDVFISGVETSTGCSSGETLSSHYGFNGATLTIYAYSSNPYFTITAKESNKFTWERKLGNTTQSFTYIRNN